MLKKIEAWFDQQSTQKRLVYVGFSLFFLAFFAFNYLYPMAADDFRYSVVKHGESLNLIENLKEIASFMHYYYFNWGGRVVAHVIAHILLLFNPVIQDILNSLALCTLVYFLYKIASNGKTNFFLFVIIATSVFYFGPAFLSSAIWITGSANYLWTTMIVFAFIYPFYRTVNGYTYVNSIGRTIFFFFAGIVAAWTNENIAPILCIIIAVYIFVLYKQNKCNIPNWVLIGFLGVIIGTVLLVLSPGNGVRAAAEGHELFNSYASMISKLPYLEGAYRYFMYRQIILFFVFLILIYLFPQDKEARKKIIYNALLFFIVANISLFSILLSPAFPPRAFFNISVLLILAFSILYANIDLKKICPKILNVALLAVLLFFAAKDYAMFFRGLWFVNKEVRPREAVIANVKAEGKNDAYFRKIMLDYRFEYTDFSNFNKDYYGINIHFVEDDDPILEKNYDK